MRYRWTFERKLTSTEVFQTGRKGSLISAGHDSSHRRRLSNNHKFTNHFLTSILVLRKKTPTNLIDNTQSFHYGAHDVPSKSFGCQLIATDVGHLVFMLHQRLWVVAFTTFVPIYGGDSIGRVNPPTPVQHLLLQVPGRRLVRERSPTGAKKKLWSKVWRVPRIRLNRKGNISIGRQGKGGGTPVTSLMTSHHRWKFRILFFQEMRIESEIFRAYHFRRHDLGFQWKLTI